MNMFTRVSGKGQVVLPKAVRDLKAWPPGTDLEVIDAGDGVILRPRRSKTLTAAEAIADFRRIYRYDGPPVSLEQMREDAGEVATGARNTD
jgi:AbrB family looped-hinge helix DNA binding protein